MRKKPVLTLLFLFVLSWSLLHSQGWVRVNQLGYLPASPKVGVFISNQPIRVNQFQLLSAMTGDRVFSGIAGKEDGSLWGMRVAYRLDFSSFTGEGAFYLEAGGVRSPRFNISPKVFDGTADFLLTYMRQQRCGFNPYLMDSCHVHDGIVVDHPTKTGTYIDVHGGWHDASDYLQYTNTSANAVSQMLFAYLKNPDAFGDGYDARGLPGKNGRPDVLDEAVWGLEWLMRMNPAPGEMYNQIADDRDHRGFRCPNKDTVSYGLNQGRPVYYVTGERQGIGPHLNRTTGVASTAGKFASAFAMGSAILKDIRPDWSAQMLQKAKEALAFGEARPGATQTACFVSPYFYEEDNYVDDMELGAAAIALAESDSADLFLRKADYWGQLEPVTPWMVSHEARHYQYYPFVNVGHYLMVSQGDEPQRQKYLAYMKRGLEDIRRQAANDPFRIGVPFIWCSNNLIAAALTQARLYHDQSGDDQFLELEAAMRDWLFGCNPWGTSMICDLPQDGDSPQRPHSSYVVLKGDNTSGGLVDGPVYRSIFENLKGIELKQADDYAPFQNGVAVYHDDVGDYSSNEPTMDGTASLVYYLSALSSEGTQAIQRDEEDAIVRFDKDISIVYLVFSADTHFEGVPKILKLLETEQIKGSFFLTGNCLRKKENKETIQHIVDNGHYLGPHSDGHLLYNDWVVRDSLLVSQARFMADLKKNIAALKPFGVDASSVSWFLPPYEWYNKQIVQWSHRLGLKLIGLTPGTGTNADYTTPEMKNYHSSDEIISRLWKYETNNPNGLNGAILLIHPGVHPDRKDKLYNRLDEIIEEMMKRGYRFGRL